VGVMATTVHYLVLVALVESGLAGPVAATAWGYLAGALAGYAANRRYTFASRVRHAVGLPRFLAVAGVGFVLNAALMAWMTAGLGIHYLVAQVTATGLVLLWNFAANRHWTFGDTGRE
jgi:putative flippase GtrA